MSARSGVEACLDAAEDRGSRAAAGSRSNVGDTHDGGARRVGMPWYRRDAYDLIRAVMVDADRMPATYDQWVLSAEQVETTVAEAVVEVIRVNVEADTFVAWCRERDYVPNGVARSRYASEAVNPPRDR